MADQGVAGSEDLALLPTTDTRRLVATRKCIRVLTRNNAHCFYSYRDEPMGFEYELAKAFAAHERIDLIVLTSEWSDLFGALQEGSGDIIAASLTVLPSRETKAAFCAPYMRTTQYVVIRDDTKGIATLQDLAGKEVHVRRDTSYHARLQELCEGGLALKPILHDDEPTEELLRRVAEGEIDITIADAHVAQLNCRYYPNLRMAFAITDKEPIAWAIRKGDSWLQRRVNAFVRDIQEDGTYDRIYQQYYGFEDVREVGRLDDFQTLADEHLPQYIAVLRTEANALDLDWRIIAAQMYEESNFRADATSPAGATGLMQLTRIAATEVGVTDLHDPHENIRGGIRYMGYLRDRFEKADDWDRLMFALASYNVGAAHVRDAQRLAQEQGLDPNRWTSVRETLPLLADKEYYTKARYGYCRGSEPVRYVAHVLIYYDILKRREIEYVAARTAAM